MKIYCVQFENLSHHEYLKCLGRVSEETREKVNRFYFKEDAIRSLLGEILVRFVLNREYSLPSNSLYFKKNEFGKPYLEGDNTIFFNISHSGKWVVCAYGSAEVGIDIEKVEKFDEEIAKKFFHAKEYVFFKDITDSTERNLQFYKLWTLKESYVKAKGKGFHIPLNSFKVEKLAAETGYMDYHVDNQVLLRVYQLDDYFLSACSQKESFPNELVFLRVEDII